MESNLIVRQDPVFVVGFPRSGTTLMQSLLAAQPGMVSFPETQFFLLVSSVLEGKPIAESVLEQLLVRFSKHLQVSEVMANRLWEMCRGKGLFTKSLFEQLVYDQIAQKSDAQDLKNRWVEKSPWHAFHMDRIITHYPQARFIFMLRNPLHCFASRRSINRIHSAGWREGWRPVESYADEWVAMMRAMEHFKTNHANNIMLVRLESLAERPQDVVRDVCNFCEINFNSDSIENHRAHANSLFGAEQLWKRDVAEFPISASIANRENSQKLSAYEQFRIAQMMGDVMAEYGYHIEADLPLSLGPEEIDIVMQTTDFYI
jgi:hypothetical protein